MKKLTCIAIALSATALASTAFAAGPSTTAPGKEKQAERSGFERLDRNNDGYLSAAEARSVPELSRDFKRFDMNNDGKLNHAEYVAASIKEDAISAKDKVVEKVNRNKADNATSGSTTRATPAPVERRTPPPTESSK